MSSKKGPEGFLSSNLCGILVFSKCFIICVNKLNISKTNLFLGSLLFLLKNHTLPLLYFLEGFVQIIN